MSTTKVLMRIVFVLMAVPLLAFLAFWIFIGINSFQASRSSIRAAEAVAKNDPRICQKLVAPFTIMGPGNSMLIHDCLVAVATAHKNPSACGGNAFCLEEASRAANNISFCNAIKSENSKGFCYGYFAVKNKSDLVCKELEMGIGKERCYLSFADHNKIDISFCINHIQSEDRYRNNCINNAARDAKDENLCQKIDNQQDIRNCIVGIRAGYARF